MKPGTMLRAACLGLAAALSACTSSSGNASSPAAGPAGRPGRVISVGSFDFPESVLLAEIYGQALGAAKFPVRILPNLGPREVVDPALMDGLLQLVPEYAGSALGFFSLGRLSATGFEWTYEGAGPAQLALALLADHLGDDAKALSLYEPFMRRVVAELDNSWELTSADIDAALAEL